MMRLLALVLLWILAALPASAATNNILLIIGDDIGVGVSSFYRTSVRQPTTPAPPTLPNLRDLANSGVLFTKAWATPWCSATRASIITGRYGFRHGVGKTIDQGSPDLDDAAVTLPRIVGDSSRNYVTRHIGKWHITSENNGPRNLGWQNGINNPPTEGGFPDPYTYFSWRSYTDGAGPTSRSTYALTFWVNEAISTINAANTANRPYFIWLAVNNPHAPFHRPPNDLHSRDTIAADCSAPTDCRPQYEAMLEALDTEIGRLLRSVDLATTTVIFIGDNGTPTKIEKSPYTAAHGKGTTYTGGVHVPLMIAGQGVTNGGRTVNELVNCVDLFPTILDLAGQADNSRLTGVKIDGVTLTPYLQNKTHPTPRRWAYAEQFVPNWNSTGWERTIRNGDFALIERQNGTRDFYNLALDPLEATDILDRTRTTVEQAALDELDAALDALIATR